MNMLKRTLGILWLITGPLLVMLLLFGAVKFIEPGGSQDIHNPVVWVLILAIFTPVGIGLAIFGWYALKGEYDRLPESSKDLADS